MPRLGGKAEGALGFPLRRPEAHGARLRQGALVARDDDDHHRHHRAPGARQSAAAGRRCPRGAGVAGGRGQRRLRSAGGGGAPYSRLRARARPSTAAAGRGAQDGPSLPTRRAPSALRRTCGDQGHLQRGRAADAGRVGASGGGVRGAGGDERPSSAGGGRPGAGQDDHDGVRLLRGGRDRQSAQHRPHPRRKQQRIRCVGGGRGRAAGAGLANGRVGDPARGVLRRRGLQADVRAHPQRRHPLLLPVRGSRGRLHAVGRGHDRSRHSALRRLEPRSSHRRADAVRPRRALSGASRRKRQGGVRRPGPGVGGRRLPGRSGGGDGRHPGGLATPQRPDRRRIRGDTRGSLRPPRQPLPRAFGDALRDGHSRQRRGTPGRARRSCPAPRRAGSGAA